MTKSELPAGSTSMAAPIEIAPGSHNRAGRVLERVQRPFIWLYVLTALVVAAGVLLQAFSIAAYIRGAGPDAPMLDGIGRASGRYRRPPDLACVVRGRKPYR